MIELDQFCSGAILSIAIHRIANVGMHAPTQVFVEGCIRTAMRVFSGFTIIGITLFTIIATNKFCIMP